MVEGDDVEAAEKSGYTFEMRFQNNFLKFEFCS